MISGYYSMLFVLFHFATDCLFYSWYFPLTWPIYGNPSPFHWKQFLNFIYRCMWKFRKFYFNTSKTCKRVRAQFSRKPVSKQLIINTRLALFNEQLNLQHNRSSRERNQRVTGWDADYMTVHQCFIICTNKTFCSLLCIKISITPQTNNNKQHLYFLH